MKCPHCGEEINPASELGKASAAKRKPTSEQMRALRALRTAKAETKRDTSSPALIAPAVLLAAPYQP